MGMTDMPHALGDKLSKIAGYKPYFRTAFGSEEITGERIAKAIVAYEQTRMSGNSAWDGWRYDRDEKAVSDPVKQGHELFFGKAKYRQCHAGNNFTDRKNKNPYLDVKMEPLRLSPAEVDAIVAFLESLDGEGYQDKAPAAFPQ